MNAAYLAKLQYEISLLSIIQKSFLRKSSHYAHALTCYYHQWLSKAAGFSAY